jgi:hypothetical protein
MKRWLYVGTGLAAAVALFASAAPAFTADNGTVDMTVQVASPCITVSPSSVTFGTKSFSLSAESPVSTDASDRPAVTNCSTSTESLFVRGSEALGSVGARWTLGTPETIAVNRYGLRLNGQAVALSNDAFGTPLAAADKRLALPVLFMPLAGSDGSGQTMSMSVTFTATF